MEDPHMQHLILKTIEATERFVLCASIAMGITQMMALTPSIAKTVWKHRYLRTSYSILLYFTAPFKNFIPSLCIYFNHLHTRLTKKGRSFSAPARQTFNPNCSSPQIPPTESGPSTSVFPTPGKSDCEPFLRPETK